MMMTTQNTGMAASRVALITGGSRGLGKSAALHLARAGWDVVVTFQARGDLADTTVAEVRALGRKAVALHLDAGVPSSFADFTAAFASVLECDFGRNSFDALVNNAGNSSNVPFAETTEQQFDDLMNVHLKGVFFLTQSLLPLLADGGRILNVSSALARTSVPGKAAYAIMKGGVEVLSRYLAKELGGRGIRVNTLSPGAIATDFSGGAVRDNPQVSAFVAANTALGRVGQPEDIGGAVAALLSDQSGWINAQCIEVSGGMFI
jgi:NAD(P)-dependent dehydrogenase (short-subunit alcohol dehydrogenase family)